MDIPQDQPPLDLQKLPQDGDAVSGNSVVPAPHPMDVDHCHDAAASSPAAKVNGKFNDKVAEKSLGIRKRGRPPRGHVKTLPPPPRQKKDEEDVCFICFDGGSLVLCDRRGCPKAYHPSCIKRDESFFRSKAKWNCGWHICSNCQKASYYMCYTCPFSLCKGCTKGADYQCVRGSKGFCGSCMKIIMLIEKSTPDGEVVQVDFDDKTSWEYLFKVYWIYLKEKLSLTVDELIRAKNPWKGSTIMAHEVSELHDGSIDKDHGSHNSFRSLKSQRKRPTRQQSSRNKFSSTMDRPCGNEGTQFSGSTKWATKELLDFVAHMRNGDTTRISPFDVQALLLEYVKRNNLRDPLQQCQIICDLRLINLFGKSCIGHFEMLNLLESHIHAKETAADNVTSTGADVVINPVESKEKYDSELVDACERKRKIREKDDESRQQLNADEYAAIDVQNINLIYLRRDLIVSLIDDDKKLNEMVVGSIVRIQIPNNDEKHDFHRLVQVVGISKISTPYTIDEKTTDVMLDILNLDKRETVSIDGISNQEFSEEECRRLRRSIKCGLVKRFSVGEILEKGRELHALKINDLLEKEISQLSHLHNQASEKANMDEIRDHAERLHRLKSPEERQRRLLEILEVRSDPTMDPSYESEEDKDESNKKRQGSLKRSRNCDTDEKEGELTSPRKGTNSNISGSAMQQNSSSTSEQSRNICLPAYVNKEGACLPSDRTSETSWAGRGLVPNNWNVPSEVKTATPVTSDGNYQVVLPEASIPRRSPASMASPAINAYSIAPKHLWPPLSYPFPTFICPHCSTPPIQTSRFCRLKPLTICSPYPVRFRPSFHSPRSIFSEKSQLSDVDEDEDEDEDEDDDDDVAAEEYDSDALGGFEQSYDEVDLSIETTEISTPPEDFKWQRVEKLLSEVREFGEEIVDVDELASIYNFRIDKFQRLAVQAFLRGSSVVVSAPTSSGKTLIAEAAAVATVARKRRLFYTTPLKALSNQKFREFRETFGENNVGLLTGDSAVNKDAQILIMTTEILRNMLYQSVGMASSASGLFHVDVIVLDEVHYLSDISRGTVWEEIVIYCPKEVQLICLSATVANPDELAGWIGQIHGQTELVTSSKRPVPLTWHFSTKTSLLPLLDEKGTRMNRKLSLNYLQLHASGAKLYKDDGSRRRNPKRHGNEISYDSTSSMSRQATLSKNDINTIRRSNVPQVMDTLWQLKSKDMLPAVWFIFSRKGCDAAVQYIEGRNLLDECERSEVELALRRFRIQFPDAVRESAVKGLLQGVAAHHAGCLPLWKSFIEELFQRGLVKVVFATETLAAGINMPARSAVIASLSKRSNNGRTQLSSNELLQMAGRAGRRGIDQKGHVVLIQTPYEGAEECCKILFAGIEPLVSQFTASYGMVLNLLAGAKVTHSSEIDETKAFLAGRTLEEARKLVEQSFGNYVGSNVMLAAKEELVKIEKEIKMLNLEITEEAIDRKSRKFLSEVAYNEIAELQEELRSEKRHRTELRKEMELQRIYALKSLLQNLGDGHLPFLCLQYKDSEGVQHSVPAVLLGNMDSSKFNNMFPVDNALSAAESNLGINLDPGAESSYYVALGSDNSWYLFTEKWIRTVYKTGFPNVALTKGDALPRELMRTLLDKEGMRWEKLADSELGSLSCMEGSLETWSWSLNVPVLNSLSENDELLQMSSSYMESLERYKEQRNRVARLKKRIARTEGFREYKKVLDMANIIEDKIRQLKARSKRLSNRIEQIEPSGWKEFLQISNVIHEIRALDINTHVMFPLGETAAAIRGENELWIAMVLRNKFLVQLKPTELAAVCASLVSEGIKIRPGRNNSYIFEPSTTVMNMIDFLEEQRSSLLHLQEKHGVDIPCCLDSQFSGMVEAWASGLTWREMMMDCAMDEGDLARLLRRTIDLLAQIPKLPDIDPSLQSNASTASNVMNRPPISELAG